MFKECASKGTGIDEKQLHKSPDESFEHMHHPMTSSLLDWFCMIEHNDLLKVFLGDEQMNMVSLSQCLSIMTFFMYHDTWQMVRASIVLLLIEYTLFVIQVFEQDADYF